jgi:integrase
MSIADIERLKDARMKEGVSNRHINGDLTVLRAVLSYAESRGVILPQLKWKRLPVRSGRVHAWSRDEVERLYATAAPSFLPVLVFLLNTGCRKGEAIAAEWSWIDFDAGLIRIPVNEWWSPKSGRPREVPMSDAVRTVLSDPRKHERWVFPSAWGRRHNRFPHEAFWAARDAAGLKGGAHTTRHTFASMFLAATKGDIGKLAEILGHSHTRTTEIYAHMVPGRLAEFRNAVNLAPK